MYMNQEELERLVNKSDRQLFINDLNTGFGVSQVDFPPSYLNRFPLFELVFALEFKPQNLILEPSNFKKI